MCAAPPPLQVKPFLPTLQQIADGLHPLTGLPPNGSKLYGVGLKRLEKFMAPTLKAVLKIGQAQLLRRQLGNVLQFSCRLDANLLYQVCDIYPLHHVHTAVFFFF